MALISLRGIADAIASLNLNEETLKGKLLHAIARRFPDEESLDTITAIDSLDLIKELWSPQSAVEIKAKRKNLSTLKSSINKDLKEGSKSGTNPEGIIIGRANIFIISDEKKDLLLDTLALAGDGSGSSLLSALAALNDLLSGSGMPTDKKEALKILNQLDSTRKSLTRLAGLSGEDGGAGKPPAAGESDNQLPLEEFAVDEDTVIAFSAEQSPAAPEQDRASEQTDMATGESEGPALASHEGINAESGDGWADILAPDSMADQGLGAGDAGQGELGAGDQFTAGVGPSETGGDDDFTVSDFEKVEHQENFAEITEEELLAELPTEPGPLVAMELDGSLPEGGGDEQEDEPAADWDSFEVVDDEFDLLDRGDLPGDAEAELAEEDVEIIDEADDLLTTETIIETDLTPDEEIETEEVEIEEITAGTAEGIIEAGLESQGIQGPTGAGEGGKESGEEGPRESDGWDSYEGVDEEIETEEVEIEEITAGTAEGSIEAGLGSPGIQGPTGAGEGGGESGEEGQQESDDWDSYEEVDDGLDFSQPTALPEDQDSGSHGPALQRSMDLSHYIEAEEALVNIPDILQEENEDYVRQILERFMPKFIKIPGGLYPVGSPKHRKTDRSPGQVSLAGFYMGQLPITNDLFDFFVRETGYETAAEQQGHGLVTSGRLHSGVQEKTGRHILAINKGVITRQVKGANWRHPEGADSSLDNRGHHPVVQVSRLDAMAFAAWAGKRLPREDEWEAAARGLAGLLFPWGNDFLPLANLEGHQTGGTTPVTYFGRQSMSPFGLLDMLGNVFEWTLSNYSSQNGQELSILKGGSWATAQFSCAKRLIEPAKTWSNTIGFRCAVDGD